MGMELNVCQQMARKCLKWPCWYGSVAGHGVITWGSIKRGSSCVIVVYLREVAFI
jgi:hypothetical protein